MVRVTAARFRNIFVPSGILSGISSFAIGFSGGTNVKTPTDSQCKPCQVSVLRGLRGSIRGAGNVGGGFFGQFPRGIMPLTGTGSAIFWGWPGADAAFPRSVQWD